MHLTCNKDYVVASTAPSSISMVNSMHHSCREVVGRACAVHCVQASSARNMPQPVFGLEDLALKTLGLLKTCKLQKQLKIDEMSRQNKVLDNLLSLVRRQKEASKHVLFDFIGE